MYVCKYICEASLDTHISTHNTWDREKRIWGGYDW